MTATMKMRFFIQPLTVFIRPVWDMGLVATEYYGQWAGPFTGSKNIPARPGEPQLPGNLRTPRPHPMIRLEDAIADVKFRFLRKEQVDLLMCLSVDDYGTLRLRAMVLGDGPPRQFHSLNYAELNYILSDDLLLRLAPEAREAGILEWVRKFSAGYGVSPRVEREAGYALAGDVSEISLREAVAAIYRGYSNPHDRAQAAESIYHSNCGYSMMRRRRLLGEMIRVTAAKNAQPTVDYWMHKAWFSRREAKRSIGAEVTDLVNSARKGVFILASELVDIAEQLESACGSDNTEAAMARIEASLTQHDGSFDPVVRASCGHWCGDDDTHLVYPSRSRWCPTCADEEARIPADRPTQLWDANHLHLHSDDEYRTYEEEDEPDDDEDDTSHERTSYGDPDRLMNYSVNPLDFVERDSSFTPSPSGDLLLGVELELILPGRQGKYIPDLRSQLGHSYAVFKADGSLDEFGAELVTAPRKLADHIHRFASVKFPSGSKAWDAGCCGMHVHIDSRGFTAMSLGKFVQFINDHANAELIRKVAGRHPDKDDQAQEYCQSIEQDLVVNPARAKGGYPNRYRMVNLTGLRSRESERLGVSGTDGKYDTVELRIFRASLRKERLLAQLEFTHASVMFCRVESYRNLKSANFLAWLTKNHFQYPNLAKWLRVVVPKPTAQRPEVSPLSVDTVHDL